MSYGREKRLLLAALAALAPLPLPFNGVVGWGPLVAFWLVVGLFAVRARRGAERWLPAWAMNLLALAYLPILFLDFSLLRRGQILEALIHIVLFALGVKLWSLARERDKWQALIAIFFVFLAAMGSSVHPAMILYLGLFTVLALAALERFAAYHELAASGAAAAAPANRGVLAGALALVVISAVPLFLFLPRLRQPYVSVPGTAGVGTLFSGFSDRVSLDDIGQVRGSGQVVFRFALEGPGPEPPELRFKSATYERYDGVSWLRQRRREAVLRRAPDGFFRLGDERPRIWATVWPVGPGGGRLALPVETVSLDLAAERVAADAAGVVTRMTDERETLEYRAGLGPRPLGRWPGLGSDLPIAAERDASRASPRLVALAAEVMGEGDDRVRAESLRRYLLREFAYDLQPAVDWGERPIERFLFEVGRGHCELFASSMVLMLRTQGIPARLVTGFYGGEFNPFQGYYIVRASNAHAWVEAWIEGSGWAIFDPTPAEGLPALGSLGLARLATQVWDTLLFRWDRYVLTYGFSDQLDVLLKLRDAWSGLWRRLTGAATAGADPAVAPAGAASDAAAAAPAEPPTAGQPLWMVAPWAALAAVLAFGWWRRRRRARARDAYRDLRALLARGPSPPPPSTPPLVLERRVAAAWPAAAAPASRLIGLYLRESFGGEELAADELAAARRALADIRAEVRAPAAAGGRGALRKSA